jgi:hypothetical protein
MFDAIGRVDRTRLGFTAIPIDAQVRVEWHPMFDKAYDVMLHIDGNTSRTVAFKRTAQGYEWIGEQEILNGPATYKTPDGTFNENITITKELNAAAAQCAAPMMLPRPRVMVSR